MLTLKAAFLGLNLVLPALGRTLTASLIPSLTGLTAALGLLL